MALHRDDSGESSLKHSWMNRASSAQMKTLALWDTWVGPGRGCLDIPSKQKEGVKVNYHFIAVAVPEFQLSKVYWIMDYFIRVELTMFSTEDLLVFRGKMTRTVLMSLYL